MSANNSCAALSAEDFAELREIARRQIDAQTWFISLTSKIGKLAEHLPTPVKSAIAAVIEPALKAGNRAAAGTHSGNGSGWLTWASRVFSGPTFHKIAATTSGAIGGSFGAPTAVIEVAASTTLVLRSIQEIARENGEDLSDPVALAECLSVLAMGGPRSDDDNLDESFWITRAALKNAITEKSIVEVLNNPKVKEAVAKEAVQRVMRSPAFQSVIQRFGVSTQALLAQKAVPVIGAAAGAYANYQFMSYYQEMARTLYSLKRVEARYEPGQAESCYRQLLQMLASKSEEPAAPSP